MGPIAFLIRSLFIGQFSLICASEESINRSFADIAFKRPRPISPFDDTACLADLISAALWQSSDTHQNESGDRDGNTPKSLSENNSDRGRCDGPFCSTRVSLGRSRTRYPSTSSIRSRCLSYPYEGMRRYERRFADKGFG